MPILGAHMSIAGGFHRALAAGQRAGCQTVQIFTKNTNQWAAPELLEEACAQWRAALAETGIHTPIGHDSYLINLASPDPVLWKKSVDAFVVEMIRAERLGLHFLVTHPGAHVGQGEEAGLKRVVEGLNEALCQTPGLKLVVLIETTAGQGTCLGHRFEHLAAILAGVRDPDRLGVCFDTCHVFAAGYPLAGISLYRRTMRAFNATVGVKQIRAFHLNDSLKPLGSRVDRHAGIGRGQLGLEPFRNLLGDRRFACVPMYLETPKGEENGEDLDVINLRMLRGLLDE